LTARRTFRCKGDSPEPILKTAQSYARRTHARWRDYPADRLYRWCDDTVIRAAPADSCIRSLGVDDWAWRKGQNYGTIFVDLLPDRMNLSAAIERALEERSGELCLASGGAAAGGSRKSTRSEESGQRWPNNENKCDAIQRYQRAIRTDLGIQRKTIRRRWLRAGQFPERKPPTGGPNSRVPGMPPNGFNYVSQWRGWIPSRIQNPGVRRRIPALLRRLHFLLLAPGFWLLNSLASISRYNRSSRW
jgi:hypothetical protein